MTSRFRLALVVGSALPLTLAGCADAFNAGPLSYVESERLAPDLKDKPEAPGRPSARRWPTSSAPTRSTSSVPDGLGPPRRRDLPGQLRRRTAKAKPVEPVRSSRTPADGHDGADRQAGGYALYRKHCLHCHGVSGAGDGPTAAVPLPPPRDYRQGIFKFTSTANGAKPTRDDLRKTIRYGLHGTSMPAFEALMSDAEIEQVIDYMIFLSMRGETELGLIDEATIADENDPEALADETRRRASPTAVFNKWKAAETQVVNPPVRRTPPTRESVLRGRELFLGLNTTGNKLECTGCHGPQAWATARASSSRTSSTTSSSAAAPAATPGQPTEALDRGRSSERSDEAPGRGAPAERGSPRTRTSRTATSRVSADETEQSDGRSRSGR